MSIEAVNEDNVDKGPAGGSVYFCQPKPFDELCGVTLVLLAHVLAGVYACTYSGLHVLI